MFVRHSNLKFFYYALLYNHYSTGFLSAILIQKTI